ncbi:hypothetical protein ACE3L8_12365 [Staphylococcus simulans]|uniref:hypothetical protein n=1 Tax=Staphylococcus simulans TaxID=1286 RepID=UPI00364C06CA
MDMNQAIQKYYKTGYVWLDAHVHDFDETLSEVPNSIEDIYLYQALYKQIIEPINKEVEPNSYRFVGFKQGTTANSLKLYFGYPVSEQMESKDGTQAIVKHLKQLTHQ